MRIAENEARFRAINERMERDLEGVVDAPDELLEFVCECGLLTCATPVRQTLAEYRRVHEDDTRFAVVAGHEIEDVEDVIERHERYWVIRKHPETWPIIER